MIHKARFSALTLLIVVSVLTACDEESSSTGSKDISTKDISAEIHVSNNQNQIIDVEVMLRSGSLDSGIDIYLEDGDSLYASTIGDFSQVAIGDNSFTGINNYLNNVKILKQGTGRSSAFFKIQKKWYYQQFPADQADMEVSVIFTRRDNLDARNSKVRIPGTFTLLSPVSGETLSRSEDIIITWNPFSSNKQVQVGANLTCSNGNILKWISEESLNSDGVFTIPANTFASQIGICSLTIRVDIRNLGQIDPVFTRGGIIIGHQIQSVAINTSP